MDGLRIALDGGNMDRDVAELLIKKLVALDEPIREATEAIDLISDLEERLHFRGQIGEIIVAIFLKLTAPVVDQYPDLDPLKDFEE
jgi:hypothetical protein